jgi:hypothetical protein
MKNIHIYIQEEKYRDTFFVVYTKQLDKEE